VGPLGHQAQPEGVGQADGVPHDGCGARVVGEVGREGPVELQLVGGQVPQVCQRAVPGAVVVDGRGDADRAQLGQDRAGPVRTAHQGVLDQLEGERPRRQPVPVQDGHDLGRQVEVADVGGGKVDRHRDLGAAGPPAGGAGKRKLEHGTGQGSHQPGLLGGWQQVCGPEQTATRVLPADQGLDADRAPVPKRHLGLQVDEKLAVPQRGA